MRKPRSIVSGCCGLAPAPEFHDGPLRFPERTRLSTGEMLRFDDTTSLVYVADPSCRSCSADIEALNGSRRRACECC